MFDIQNTEHQVIADQVIHNIFCVVPPANEICVGEQTGFANYAKVINAMFDQFVFGDGITHNGAPLVLTEEAQDRGVAEFIIYHTRHCDDLV